MNILQRFVEIFRFGGDIRENCALGVVAVVSAKSTSTRTRHDYAETDGTISSR